MIRSPSTRAVCTASGIMLTESPSSGLLDEAAFDEDDEEELLAAVLDTALELTLDSTLLSALLDEVSSALEVSGLTVSEEPVELAKLLELDELAEL